MKHGPIDGISLLTEQSCGSTVLLNKSMEKPYPYKKYN